MPYARGVVERAMTIQEVILRAIAGQLTWLQAADIRRRREPRPCFGELLHLDGSRHRWLALVPDRWFTLLAVVDDATKHVLYAQLHDGGESVAAIMTALRTGLERYGLPLALYTDRAHWAVHTPTSGSAPDRRHPTQVGRALARLGTEHLPRYSPQARGRSERVNRTRQDRLVNELRLAGVTTVAAAHRYLGEQFLPGFNAEFGRPPADPSSAFVPLGRQRRDGRWRAAASRQAARAAHLRRPARPRAASPQRPSLALVWHPLPRPLRPPRPPAAGRLMAHPFPSR